MSTLNITLFGAPRIERDGAAVTLARRKSLALLAYLAVTRQPHGRDALATLLWPDADSERARAGLRRALVDLNVALGKGWVEVEGDQIALRAGGDLQVDVRSFRDALAAVARHRHPRSDACADCLAELSRAADLYKGDFLAGFTLPDAAEFDAWQTCQTETCRLELAEALEALAESYAEHAEPARGLPHARRWLALDPLCEPAHRCLMRLYVAAGDRHAALRQFTACQEALQAELGIPPEPETSALYERIKAGLLASPRPRQTPRQGEDAAPSFGASDLSGVAAGRAALPPAPAAFFGRAAELAQIAARLADPACRLLTILGPGGAGKTTLALQAAAALADAGRVNEGARFPAGVFFAPLANVSSAETLPSAILQALAVPARSSVDPQRQLLDHLADRRLLLVLDNFEQLLGDQESGDGGQGSGNRGQASGVRGQGAEDGARLLVEILRAAPGIKLLVTSRERLNLRDEWLLPLGGLALSPGSGDLGSGRSPTEPVTDDLTEAGLLAETTPAPPDLEAHAATQLFLHAARRVRPDFQPDADAARLIVRICRLVDGLPLAIELTAAWVRVLPLAEIARRLEAGLDLLATTQRDVPARHRSMRAAFDHSWRLLSAHERSILRQLSVFRGGCTAEAAEAVVGAKLLDLTGLADKSWLRIEPAGRYDLHELVRQYCDEKLSAEHAREAGETPDQVRDRHCVNFASLAEPYERTFQPPHKPDWRELIPDLDNLQVAWWRAGERRDAGQLRQLLPFAGVYELLGRYRAFLQILEANYKKLHMEWLQDQFTDRAPNTALILACLCWGKAAKLTSLDLFADVLAAVDAGLKLLERAERCALWQSAYVFLRVLGANAISHLGEPARAERLLAEVADYLTQADAHCWLTDPEVTLSRWQAWVSFQRSVALSRLGYWTEALSFNTQAHRQFAVSRQVLGIATAFSGFILYLQGHYAEAHQCVQTALGDWHARGDVDGIGLAFAYLAEIEAATGEVATAHEHFRRGLAIGRTIDRNGLVCFSLEGLGRLELEMGRSTRSAELYRESLAFGERSGMTDYHTSIALGGLGRAALALGDRAGARDFSQRALRYPVYWVHDRIEAIATLAQVFAAEGDMLRAVELLAFAVAHPATAHRVRQPLARLLAELECELPAEQFAVAAARGRARELDEVVAELTGEPARQAADGAAALI